MEWPFALVGKHFQLPGGKSSTCPEFTTEGEEQCPVCGVIKLLKVGSVADQSLADSIKLSKQYWMNVVIRDPADHSGDMPVEGPKIMQAGPMIFQQIVALIENPEYGDVSSPEKGIGVDLTISKTGVKMDTKYAVNTRRTETPLHTDPDEIARILDEAWDLSWTLATGDAEEDAEQSKTFAVLVPAYDQMVERYGLAPGVDLATIDWEGNVQQDTQSASPSPRLQRGAPERQVVAEPEVEEEVEPTDEVGAEIAARRRRTRRPTA